MQRSERETAESISCHMEENRHTSTYFYLSILQMSAKGMRQDYFWLTIIGDLCHISLYAGTYA